MKNKKLMNLSVVLLALSFVLTACEGVLLDLPQQAIPGNEIETEEIVETETDGPTETDEPTKTETPSETGEPTKTETPSETETDEPPILAESDWYQIEFLGKVDNENETSTWEYEVMEKEGAQDLSYWVLELPACAVVLNASPEPYEVVAPDPNTNLYGIKWEMGAGFLMDTYSVTLFQQLEVDVRDAAFKGPDLFNVEIAGPTCGDDYEDEAYENDYWEWGYDIEDYDDLMEWYGEIEIPYGQLPPEGECKLWNPFLPDGQQSEPIPCDCSYLSPYNLLIDHQGDVVDCEMSFEDEMDEYDDLIDEYTGLNIPEGQFPPPGECKVWDPELDSGQQSEPISCLCSYVEPGTYLIDHYGQIVDCDYDE